jgi:hypothetical protein
MKLIAMIFLTVFLGKGCDADTRQTMETAVIEYEANTRGFYRKVVIKNQTLTLSKDRSGNDKPAVQKISDADWKELIAAFEAVNRDGISELKAPSEKRFYDGSPIGGLTVTYKGKTYQSAPFDHGNPPQEIARLVNKITSYIKRE